MTDPAFTLRSGSSGPVVTGTPGNALAFDASGTKLEGVPLAAGGVTSFNTRTGAVVPAANDYAASQVANDSSVTGATVKLALNTLLAAGGAVASVFGRVGAVVAAVNDYAASQITNDSSVAGTGVKGALNTLLAAFNTQATLPVFPALFDNGNSGATKTIDWSLGGAQKLTLTATCVVTNTNLPAGKTCWVQLTTVQGGAGSFGISFVGQQTPGGSPILLTPTIGAKDELSLFWNGTNVEVLIAGLGLQ